MYLNATEEGALLKMLRRQEVTEDDRAAISHLFVRLTERWRWRKLVADDAANRQAVDGDEVKDDDGA